MYVSDLIKNKILRPRLRP